MMKHAYKDPKPNGGSGPQSSSKPKHLPDFNASTKKELIYLAKVCHQSERFEDMLNFMKQVVSFQQDLGVLGRNLLSAAYKSSISPIRTAWRVLEAIEEKEESRGGRRSHLIRDAKKRLKREIEEICNDAIELITKNVLPYCNNAESKAYFYKMKGDYYRFIAETAGEDEILRVAQLCFDAYQEATTIADTELEVCNPTRMSIALNFSVFCYEILHDVEQAKEVAKQAFYEYVEDQREDSGDQEANILAQLIRENLTMWGAEEAEGVEGEDEQ